VPDAMGGVATDSKSRDRRLTRTLQLTRPSVASLPQDLAAERQSLGRAELDLEIAAVESVMPLERGGIAGA